MNEVKFPCFYYICMSGVLRFADDIVLISSDPDELGIMLHELEESSQAVALKEN